MSHGYLAVSVCGWICALGVFEIVSCTMLYPCVPPSRQPASQSRPQVICFARPCRLALVLLCPLPADSKLPILRSKPFRNPKIDTFFLFLCSKRFRCRSSSKSITTSLRAEGSHYRDSELICRPLGTQEQKLSDNGLIYIFFLHIDPLSYDIRGLI